MGRKTCICLGCGVEYIPKEANRNKYCSRECAFKNRRKNEWLFKSISEYSQLVFSHCCLCEGLFIKKHPEHIVCSDLCRKKYDCVRSRQYNEAKYKPKTITCLGCQAILITEYGNKRQKYCSDVCEHNYRKPIQHRIHNHRRRIRIHNALYERIDPFDIFERDKWMCKLCGVETPRLLRGTYKPNAPELDHIVPLAVGGPHTWDNLQLLCRRCNSVKGATLYI